MFERCLSCASSMIDPIRNTIPNQRKVKAETRKPAAWLSAPLSSAPAHTLPVSTVAAAITRAPFLTVVFCGRRVRAATGRRGRRAAGGPAGRSAVSAERSSCVRDASA